MISKMLALAQTTLVDVPICKVSINSTYCNILHRWSMQPQMVRTGLGHNMIM